MNQINIDTEEFVKNLKVTFFDISSQSQEVMNRIEFYLSREKEPQKIENLQNLWALYHDTVKTFLSNVESISSALYTLESCNQNFNSFVEEKKAMDAQMNNSKVQEPIVSVSNEEKEEVNTPEVVEASVPASTEVSEEKEEVNTSEVVEASVPESTEVSEEKEEVNTPEVVEASVPESTEVSEEKKEVNTPEVVEAPVSASTEISEEKEEVKTPEVVEAPVSASTEVSEEKEEVNTPEVVEAPVSASTEVSEEKEEVNTSEVVEAPVINTQNETITIVDENSNLVEPTDEEKTNETIVSMEENPTNDKITDNQTQVTDVVLPVIEEENLNTSKANEANTNVDTEIPIIADIPSLSTSSEINNATTNDKMVFHKGMLVNDKAILVNVSQASNLRASIPNQKELFKQAIFSTNEENVSAEQLEEMMNQLSVLYEQGKTKEAEEMSEKISVLNKKMTSAS